MKKKQVKISLKDILKGKFLVDENSFEHWRFVAFLVILAIVSIVSSHWADKKVVRVRKMQQHLSELRSEYAYTHKALMYEQVESRVAEKLKESGIQHSEEQPYLLYK